MISGPSIKRRSHLTGERYQIVNLMDDDPEEAGFFRVTFDEITALYFANLPRQMHSMPGSPFLRLLRCCYRKHPTRQFYKISVLGGMVSCKIVCVLTKY